MKHRYAESKARKCDCCGEIRKIHRFKLKNIDICVCKECMQDIEFRSTRMCEGIVHHDELEFVCPFYLESRQRSITCEASFDGARHIISFDMGADCELYKKRYCCSFGYEQCKLFKAIAGRTVQ